MNPDPVSPYIIGMVVFALLTLGQGGVLLYQFLRARSAETAALSEPRMNPPAHRQFASVGQLAEITRRVEANEAKLDELIRSNDQRHAASMEARRKIHAELNDLSRVVAALKESDDYQKPALVRLEDKMNTMLDRIGKAGA